MRFALSLLAIFAIAVAAALLAGNNQGTVTLFWPPYRVDLSLNLLLLGLTAVFITLHFALRALSLLFGMPREARRWRIQHRERAMFVALLDSLSHLFAGRYIRARKSAELVLSQESVLHRGGEKVLYGDRLRAMSHLLAAESAHFMQNRDDRETHLRLALEQSSKREAHEAREGVQLRAARWAMDDRDALASLNLLNELPHGASRRTVALRLRLKAARLAGQIEVALETARLLAKHRAFSTDAGKSIVRGLTLELINSTHDAAQLQTVWAGFDSSERLNPDMVLAAAQRLLALDGAPVLVRAWLLPVWDLMLKPDAGLAPSLRNQLITALEDSFAKASGAPDSTWLTRIETAQMRNPADATLQYLAGVVCMQLQLWGKAHMLLTQSLPKLQNSRLEQKAWLRLATLAERRGDAAAVTQAYKNAVGSGLVVSD